MLENIIRIAKAHGFNAWIDGASVAIAMGRPAVTLQCSANNFDFVLAFAPIGVYGNLINRIN